MSPTREIGSAHVRDTCFPLASDERTRLTSPPVRQSRDDAANDRTRRRQDSVPDSGSGKLDPLPVLSAPADRHLRSLRQTAVCTNQALPTAWLHTHMKWKAVKVAGTLRPPEGVFGVGFPETFAH